MRRIAASEAHVAGALSRILLRDGPLTVGIAPAWGGALTRFDVRRGAALIPILRPAADHPAAAHAAAALPALSASSFPMLPYCGRLRAGQRPVRQLRVTPHGAAARRPAAVR